LVKFVVWGTLLFIGALAACVLTQLLTGGINTRHLLYGRTVRGRAYFSPERVQLLLFTAWVALSYLLQAVEKRSSGELPDIPSTTLALLGGSHALYLGGKAYSMLFKKIPKGEQ